LLQNNKIQNLFVKQGLTKSFWASIILIIIGLAKLFKQRFVMCKTKKTTINDVAQQCKVSKTAVSLVLNNKTTRVKISPDKAELILKTANKMNYRPLQAAQELSKRRKAKIKTLLLSPWMTDSYFMAEVYNALQKVSNRLTFERDFFIPGELDKTLKKEYLPIYDAVILMGTSNKDHLFLKELGKSTNVVLFNRHVAGCSSYLTDNVASGELLARHILATDYYDNYYLWKPYGASQAIKDRESGIKKIFKESGKKIEVLKVVQNSVIYEYFSSRIDMFRTGKSLIFFNYDDIALQSMLFFLKNGFSIPEKIGLVGHDNISSIRNLEPRITTIDTKMSAVVLHALKDIIEGNLTKKAHYFKPKLISGTSSK
jgi:LacI family transcriptional regulator